MGTYIPTLAMLDGFPTGAPHELRAQREAPFLSPPRLVFVFVFLNVRLLQSPELLS